MILTDAEKFISLDTIDEAAEAVRERLTRLPRVGMILGSGLGSLAEAVDADAIIPYKQIPHFPHATVGGHVGQLVAGELEGQRVVVMQGRAHYYEGYSISHVGLPVRVMQALGIEVLIVTNAAGGLNPTFQAGDVMLIRDHINLIGMAGLSPLRGPNLDRFGPRFPDMSRAYELKLREIGRAIAAEAGIPLREGVYVCLAGPNYETPADIRFLRVIGADAVGMSTVPEVIVARHGGTRVLGISGITNMAILDKNSGAETTHEEVLEVGQILTPRVERLVRGVLRQL